MTLGVCDAQKTGVVFAVAITSKEDERAYVRLFETIHAAANSDLYPTHIVHDAAVAIFNAVARALPGTTSILCFFHVMQNLRRWNADYAADLLPDDKTFLVNTVRRLQAITNQADAARALTDFTLAMSGRSPACNRWIAGWAPMHCAPERRTWIAAFAAGAPTTVRNPNPIANFVLSFRFD